MKIRYNNPHKSISGFPSVELPSFTVVVGPNGSGKTHLLEALANGQLHNDVAPFDPHMQYNSVKLLTITDFQRSKELFAQQYQRGGGDPIGSYGSLDVEFEFLRRGKLKPFYDQLDSISENRLKNHISEKEIWIRGSEWFISNFAPNKFANDVKRIFHEAEAHLNEHEPPGRVSHRWDVILHLVKRAAKLKNQKIIELNPFFLRLFSLNDYQQEQFSLNLAVIFGVYRDRKLVNWIAQKKDAAGNSSYSLSDEEFISSFGDSPWDAVNENLKIFSLPFRVTEPDDLDFGRYTLHLIHLPTGTVISPEDLSSGEKVLFNFAVSTLAEGEAMSVKRPRLLLLDEMDGPLHPEMLNRLLGAISMELVDRRNITVMLTTHSPTTAAMVPEESLYEMRVGEPGLFKITKQQAVDKLTFGVPTLAIDYSGQRTVFVESNSDAQIYTKLYSIIKSRLNLPKQLNFVSTGLRKKNGVEINTGCEIVKNLVKSLNDSGSKVFGLIDWDGDSREDESLFVMGENKINGLENLILNPLLVAVLLLKFRKLTDENGNLCRYGEINQASVDTLQNLANIVQYKVVGISSRPIVRSSYLSAMSLDLCEAYMLMDDHKLEDVVIKEFPYLNRWKSQGSDRLLMAIVDEVIYEHPELCPAPVKEVFEKLSSASI